MDFPVLSPSVNSKTVLNSPSKATAAENFLPCLLLKPLITPVRPWVSSAVISASESVFPAFTRNTGSPHAALSQRTTLPKNCIRPVLHLGQGHSDPLCVKSLSEASSSVVICLV